MVYAATQSESHRVMHCQNILEEFGLNVQKNSWSRKIIADTLSIFPYVSIDKNKLIVMKSHCRANDLFDIGRV